MLVFCTVSEVLSATGAAKAALPNLLAWERTGVSLLV